MRRRYIQTRPFADVVLPWGLKIRICPCETIGLSIWRSGVFDLCVSEAIWRLLDVGEKAIDVGANIGYMTSIMVKRVGKNGSVSAFEPHPEIFQELKVNTETWRRQRLLGEVAAHELALSENNGFAVLGINDDFKDNRGVACLMSENQAESSKSIIVETKSLDELYDTDQFIGLMKIDVEGHEFSVLKGGDRLLRRHQIRDIIFEEHKEPPTAVTEYLKECGYTVFYISKVFLGIKVQNLGSLLQKPTYDSPCYIATIDPLRALSRLRKKGWMVLK